MNLLRSRDDEDKEAAPAGKAGGAKKLVGALGFGGGAAAAAAASGPKKKKEERYDEDGFLIDSVRCVTLCRVLRCGLREEPHRQACGGSRMRAAVAPLPACLRVGAAASTETRGLSAERRKTTLLSLPAGG